MANTTLGYKVIRRSTNQQKKNRKSVKKNLKTVTKKNKRKIRSRNKSRIKKGGMDDSQDDSIQIEIRIDEETKKIRVNPNHTVLENVIANIEDLGLPHNNTRFILQSITMGDDEIALEGTFNENGIEDGARLDIHKRERISFEDVLAEIKDLNPGVDEEGLRTGADNINEDKPWHIRGNLILFDLGISQLPESFGNLTVGGSVLLDDNQLTSLPESFGNLTVGEHLSLYGNQLTSLPESFGNLTLGGNVYH